MVLIPINQSLGGFRILDSPPLPAEHPSPPSLLSIGRITINPIEVRLFDFDLGAAMPNIQSINSSATVQKNVNISHLLFI